MTAVESPLPLLPYSFSQRNSPTTTTPHPTTRLLTYPTTHLLTYHYYPTTPHPPIPSCHGILQRDCTVVYIQCYIDTVLYNIHSASVLLYILVPWHMITHRGGEPAVGPTPGLLRNLVYRTYTVYSTTAYIYIYVCVYTVYSAVCGTKQCYSILYIVLYTILYLVPWHMIAAEVYQL